MWYMRAVWKELVKRGGRLGPRTKEGGSVSRTGELAAARDTLEYAWAASLQTAGFVIRKCST